MTEKEYRQCIAEALLPKYHIILAEADSSHEFSPDFEKRMDKLIRQRRSSLYRFTNTFGKRVAVIIIGLIAVSFTTVMSVEALRTPFLEFITSRFSDHSEVKTIDGGDNYPEKIESDYVITYNLSDYNIERDERTDQDHKINYRKDNVVVCYYQSVISGYNYSFNTESADVEHIDINGYDAIGFLDNNNYYTLVWNNGEYIIETMSNIGKDALIEIANSVQKAE